MIFCRIVIGFGLLNFIVLVVATIQPLGIQGLEYGLQRASSLMILQALVSAAMVYAGREKIRGSDLGKKAFPASLMSYVLWLCMTLRWIAQ